MGFNLYHLLLGVQLTAVLTIVVSSTINDTREEVFTNLTMLPDNNRNQRYLLHDTSHLRKPDQVDCVELKTTRYISDGKCNSAQPVKDTICISSCFRIRQPLDGLEQKPKLEEWHCKKDAMRRRKVKLICKDGTHRVYKVQLVKNCTCEKKHLTSRKKMSKPELHVFRRIEGRIQLFPLPNRSMMPQGINVG